MNDVPAPALPADEWPVLSQHARDRALQRKIPVAAIRAAIRFGKSRRQTATSVHVLGWRQVRACLRRFRLDFSAWIGVAVVLGHDGTVVTAYRSALPHAHRRSPRFREAVADAPSNAWWVDAGAIG